MIIILLVRDMGGSFRVPKFLRKTKVDYVDKMGGFSYSHDKVGRFDITMNKRVCVDKLDTRDLR